MQEFDPARLAIRSALVARKPRALEVPAFRRAAVLVPILKRPTGATMLFTQRTQTVREHQGQISFPGGRFEGEEDAEGAALREDFEDVDPATGRYQVYFFEPDGRHVIWGLTARILKQLLDIAFAYSKA